MKRLIVLIIFCYPISSKSQITISELLNIYNMGHYKFEKYSKKIGYSLNDFGSNDSYFWWTYDKGTEDNNIKFIYVVTPLWTKGEYCLLTFAVFNVNTSIKLEKELSRNGFKFIRNQLKDNITHTLYSNGKFTIDFHEHIQDDGKIEYRINIEKGIKYFN